MKMRKMHDRYNWLSFDDMARIEIIDTKDEFLLKINGHEIRGVMEYELRNSEDLEHTSELTLKIFALAPRQIKAQERITKEEEEKNRIREFRNTLNS